MVWGGGLSDRPTKVDDLTVYRYLSGTPLPPLIVPGDKTGKGNYLLAFVVTLLGMGGREKIR